MAAQGLLSVVGTPIGNLSDAAPRVVETLCTSDLVLCEDTRVTSRLLAHFDVHVPLQRADENVLTRRVEGVLERLSEGQHVSFVSDAGMPGVSDPGQRLVDAALDAGLRVEVVPGPSAVTCALVASGLPMEHFFFEGFLPRKKGAIATRLRELAPIPGALVFYESPHRVAATLQVMAEVFPQRRVALVRELTKLHEETVRGLTGQVAQELAERDEVRGECVVVLEGPVAGEEAPAQEQALSLDEAIAQGLAAGESKTRLAKRLAKELGLPRSDVYDRIVELS
ncbi:MAG: 16S rRNA (cytidine(1402)-2'-O)-methyltransferase [Atopobiaceae bacterium]|nr:16S rRNA (cytidine(1402)-2'-O)-methyltransferase [Atopobiaceae bacterium]